MQLYVSEQMGFNTLSVDGRGMLGFSYKRKENTLFLSDPMLGDILSVETSKIQVIDDLTSKEV